MISNWGEWSICWRAELPFRRTLAIWRNRPWGNSNFNKRKRKSCTWAESTPCGRTSCSQLAWSWLPRKGAGSPGEHHIEPVSSVPCGNKSSSAYWPVLAGVKPAGQRKWLFSPPWHSWDLVWNYVSSLESPGTREIDKVELRRRPGRYSREHKAHEVRLRELALLSLGKRTIRRNFTVVFNYLRSGCREDGPDSSWSCTEER